MRATSVLLALALGLGAWIWLYEIRGQEDREELERAEQRLLSLAADDVTALQLPLPDGRRAKVVRAGEGWELETPLRYPADTASIDAILNALVELEARTSFEDTSPELLAHYGLEGPGPRIHVWTGAEEPAVAIALGRETPLGGQVYAAIEGDERVHTVASTLTGTLAPELDTLRDKRITRIEPEEVTEVRISRPGELVAELKRAGEGESAEWSLVAPVEDQADQARVERLLRDLTLARATAFVAEAAADEDYGLDSPERSLLLVTATGTEMLDLGRAGDKAYARRQGDALVFEVAAFTLDQVPGDVFELRNKSVLELDAGDVARIELAFPRDGAAHAFVRRDEVWQAEDEAIAVQDETVEGLLFALESLQATGIEESPAAPATYGLEPPSVRVTFRDDEGSELASLALGDPEPGRGLPARSSQSERVWRVINDLGESVPLGREAFENRWLAEAEPAVGSGEDPTLADPTDLSGQEPE